MNDVYITSSSSLIIIRVSSIERTQFSTKWCLVDSKFNSLNTLMNVWTITTLFVDSVGTQDKDNKGKAEKEQHCHTSPT